MRPELLPGRVVLAAVARVAHQKEGPVEARGGDRPVDAPVQVGARHDAVIRRHHLRRGVPAERVPEHAGPAQAERTAQAVGQRAALGIGIPPRVQAGQLVRHEPGVVLADPQRLRDVLVGRPARLPARFEAPSRELHDVALVRVVDGDDRVAATGQVLDQRGAEGALRAVARGEEHDRQPVAVLLDGGVRVRVRERQIHGVQGRVKLLAHFLFVQRRRLWREPGARARPCVGQRAGYQRVTMSSRGDLGEREEPGGRGEVHGSRRERSTRCSCPRSCSGPVAAAPSMPVSMTDPPHVPLPVREPHERYDGPSDAPAHRPQPSPRWPPRVRPLPSPSAPTVRPTRVAGVAQVTGTRTGVRRGTGCEAR